MKHFFCVLILGFLLCASASAQTVNYNLEPGCTLNEGTYIVEKIFFHDEGKYSFLIQQGETELIQTDWKNYGSSNIRIFRDVKNGKSWVRVIGGYNCGLEIHLRVSDDINGGGWSRSDGETISRGMTNVLR